MVDDGDLSHIDLDALGQLPEFQTHTALGLIIYCKSSDGLIARFTNVWKFDLVHRRNLIQLVFRDFANRCTGVVGSWIRLSAVGTEKRNVNISHQVYSSRYSLSRPILKAWERIRGTVPAGILMGDANSATRKTEREPTCMVLANPT